MATTISRYNCFSENLTDQVHDLEAGTFYLALVDSSYVYSAAHTVYSDFSASELAAGGGYTTGGQAITNPVTTQAAGVTTWDADNTTFTALTKTFRAGIIYENTGAGASNPIIAYVLFDDSPADVTINGVDFVVMWNASGILTVG